MKFVVFGLGISSSWGNGHATLPRGLFKALVMRGHRNTFFERDAGVHLELYSDWEAARATAHREWAAHFWAEAPSV
jgi:spore maturation protein CgeB